MNKTTIGLGILAVLIVGWFLLGSNTTGYVATVTDEVAQLESELATLEAAVAAGTLSPEAAAEAQVKIVARIDAANNAATAGQKAKLTDAQRVQLLEGLDRLKRILTEYRATLVAVDEAVLELPETKRPRLRRGGSVRSSAGVASIAHDAIATVNEQVEDIADDITDEAILEEVEDIVEDAVEGGGETDETTPSDETGGEEDATSTEDLDGAVTDDSSDEAADESGDTGSEGEETTEETSETGTDEATEDTTDDFIFSDTEVEVEAETTN